MIELSLHQYFISFDRYFFENHSTDLSPFLGETDTFMDEMCRKMGISEATFYNWKKKYGGLGVSELWELRQFKEENSQLKKLVADLSLDKQMLQGIIKKKL